jgi:DNA-binding transcriptional LysR family regulator
LKKRFENALHAQENLRHGYVNISLSEGLAICLMEEVLSEFIARYPKVEVAVNIRATNEILGDVLENTAHIGLAYNPPLTPKIECLASSKHEIILAVNPCHPWAARSAPLSFGEAIAYPYGLMPAAYGLGQLIAAVAHAENIRLTPTLTANSLAVLKEFAKSGNGGAFVTDFSVEKEIAAGDLVALAIDQPLLMNRYAKIVVKADRPLTRAARELLTWIQIRMATFQTTRDADKKALGTTP